MLILSSVSVGTFIESEARLPSSVGGICFDRIYVVLIDFPEIFDIKFITTTKP